MRSAGAMHAVHPCRTMNRVRLCVRRPTSTRATSCSDSLIRGTLRPANAAPGNSTRSRSATLLLLLYGAGLRFSEAPGLTLADVDLSEAILTIRDTKFYKSRLVPVGSQLAAA